jgi:lipoprotein-anchoring transpeptidase ErfK/SrfK
VPKYPASHGCIRLPYLTDENPARFFYEWIDKGTPITIIKK